MAGFLRTPAFHVEMLLHSLSVKRSQKFWHPAADSAGKLALDNALIGMAGNAGVEPVREFLLRRFTAKVPQYAKGKS